MHSDLEAAALPADVASDAAAGMSSLLTSRETKISLVSSAVTDKTSDQDDCREAAGTATGATVVTAVWPFVTDDGDTFPRGTTSL